MRFVIYCLVDFERKVHYMQRAFKKSAKRMRTEYTLFHILIGCFWHIAIVRFSRFQQFCLQRQTEAVKIFLLTKIPTSDVDFDKV